MLQHECACVRSPDVACDIRERPSKKTRLPFLGPYGRPRIAQAQSGLRIAYSVARMKRSDIRDDAGSDGAQIIRGRLSGPTVGNDVERDLLALIEALHAGAFDRADMHEYVLSAAL